MSRFWLLSAAATLSLALAQALAQAPVQPIPIVPPDLKNPIVPVQVQPTIPEVPRVPAPQPTPPATASPPIVAPNFQGAPGAGTTTPDSAVTPSAGTQPAAAPAGTQATSVTGAGGAAAAVNAPDASDLLGKSTTSLGVDIQRRNPIIADPRIRGLRPTQFNTYADGGFFIPSRLDLDSVISRFDPGSIASILVIKGPYSALHGPALSFIDVTSLGSPRYDCLEYHGRTAMGYQTNGQRWDGVQTILVGDKDWGFRATYNILQGNDYQDGYGRQIASSYLSHNVSFALGVDFSENSRLEFKGFSVVQSGVELPGYYFDIDSLNADSYTIRYSLKDQNLFDKLTLDLWYNSTASSGTTQYGPKQAFVDALLKQSFFPNSVPDAFPIGNPFTDTSSTRFAGRSIGYRLATSWGDEKNALLTIGTDLNVFGQGLIENIRFTQSYGTNLNTGVPLTQPTTYTLNQSIPQSQSSDPGVFLQAEYAVTEAFKVRLGGRYDYVFTDVYQARVNTGNLSPFGVPTQPALNGRAPTPADINYAIYSVNPSDTTNLQRYFNLGSGFLSTEYKVTDKITGTAAVGYAMRAPTLTELYATGPFIGVLQQGTSRLIGDPNLKAEKLLQGDLGIVANYEMWQAGVNAFYAWINDYITYDANRLGNGLTQVIYTNTNRATLAGCELFGQFEATSWLTPFGTLSYVQGIDQTVADNRRNSTVFSTRRDAPQSGFRRSATEPLPGIPPLESRLGLRFHEASKNPHWQVEVTARVVADQNLVAASLGELPTGGFTTLDIRTFYKITDNWLVTFGVENIGNINYREHLDPISGNQIGYSNNGVFTTYNPLFRQGINYYFGSQLTY